MSIRSESPLSAYVPRDPSANVTVPSAKNSSTECVPHCQTTPAIENVPGHVVGNMLSIWTFCSTHRPTMRLLLVHLGTNPLRVYWDRLWCHNRAIFSAED